MPTLAFTTRPPANPLRELPTHSLHFPFQIFFLRTTPELKLNESESQGLRVEKKTDNLTPVGTTKKLIRGGERESVNGEDWRLFKLSCRDSAAATLPTAASGPGIAQQIPTCLLLLCSHKQLRKGARSGGLTGKQALQNNEPGQEGFPLWVSAFLSWDLFCPYFFFLALHSLFTTLQLCTLLLRGLPCGELRTKTLPPPLHGLVSQQYDFIPDCSFYKGHPNNLLLILPPHNP